MGGGVLRVINAVGKGRTSNLSVPRVGMRREAWREKQGITTPKYQIELDFGFSQFYYFLNGNN